jgi:hypothetical protein
MGKLPRAAATMAGKAVQKYSPLPITSVPVSQYNPKTKLALIQIPAEIVIPLKYPFIKVLCISK